MCLSKGWRGREVSLKVRRRRQGGGEEWGTFILCRVTSPNQCTSAPETHSTGRIHDQVRTMGSVSENSCVTSVLYPRTDELAS
jgi:hypothetical protein